MYSFIRTTDIIVAPDLVADVKDYLRDKEINFKVLVSDIQVKTNKYFAFVLYVMNITSFRTLHHFLCMFKIKS